MEIRAHWPSWADEDTVRAAIADAYTTALIRLEQAGLR